MSLTYFNARFISWNFMFILVFTAILLSVAHLRNQDDTEPTRRGQRLR